MCDLWLEAICNRISDNEIIERMTKGEEKFGWIHQAKENYSKMETMRDQMEVMKEQIKKLKIEIFDLTHKGGY